MMGVKLCPTVLTDLQRSANSSFFVLVDGASFICIDNPFPPTHDPPLKKTQFFHIYLFHIV